MENVKRRSEQQIGFLHRSLGMVIKEMGSRLNEEQNNNQYQTTPFLVTCIINSSTRVPHELKYHQHSRLEVELSEYKEACERQFSKLTEKIDKMEEQRRQEQVRALEL